MSDLQNMRIAVIAVDGYEEQELTDPVRALKQAGATVEILSEKRHDEKALPGRVSASGTARGCTPEISCFRSLP